MKVSVLVERWVGSDEMHTAAVHSSEKWKIVSMKEGPVLPVLSILGCHDFLHSVMKHFPRA